jgi:hypothetical protein
MFQFHYTYCGTSDANTHNTNAMRHGTTINKNDSQQRSIFGFQDLAASYVEVVPTLRVVLLSPSSGRIGRHWHWLPSFPGVVLLTAYLLMTRS